MEAKVDESRHCRACGGALGREGASAGLCFACLFELALESPSRMAEVDTSSAAETLAYSGESLAVGSVLGGRYRVRALLGRGGMGEVWRARDLKLKVDVALKALRREWLDNERALETLRREVRTAREVISPNVCRVFDLVELDGQELVSMEYIDGVTLADILTMRAPLDLTEAREIALQFLAGLEAIHQAGLVHRDLKPENIMMTRTGRVVLMDFGIAKGLADNQAGTVSGTPAYMSPEQARGEAVTARADVFAIGVVLAEMVAPRGLRRFEDRQRIWEGIRADPPRLSESPWAALIKKAIAPNAEQRYISASALARALEEVTLRVADAEAMYPYPGLASFTEDDAEYFFGRELEVEELWKRLPQAHLVGLIGPSGAGKSSFVRAGLLAVLPSGWRALVVTPGRRPFTALAQALADEISGDSEAVRRLVRFEEPDVAVSLFADWRRGHDETLVIVDQFEELFTQNPPEIQDRFADLLGRLALEADAHLLLAMRDDFLFHCQGQEALRPLFSELVPLGPLTGSALRRALVQPALKCGYKFEDDALVDEMEAEIGGERGALPLLAFAAARLWEHRDRERGVLTRAAYEQIGGVGGALARHAERTLERIGQDKLPVVRELFRNLVTAQGTRVARTRDELLSVFSVAQEAPAFRSAAHGAGDAKTGAKGRPAQPTRYSDDGTGAGQGSGTKMREPSRPETLDHNCSNLDAATVLDTLIDARLLTSYEEAALDDDQATQQRIEIVHESLLSQWPRLVRWQSQDSDSAQFRDQLRQAAQMWQERGRPDDLLWTGTSFKEYELWRERYRGGLTKDEEAYAGAMSQRAFRRRRRRRLAVTGVIAVLLAIVAVVSVSRQQAVEAAQRAEAAKLVALGRLALEDEDPTTALAYATSSLELADSAEARRFALEALWRGPPAFIDMPEEPGGDIWLDFSPDGAWLAAGTNIGTVTLRRREGGEATILGRHDGVQPRVGFTREGRLVSKGLAPDRWLRLWEPSIGRELARLDVGPESGPLYLRHDRLFLLSSGESGRRLRSWEIAGENFRPVCTSEPGAWGADDQRIADVDLDPTGSWLAWGWQAEPTVFTRSLRECGVEPFRPLAEAVAEIRCVAVAADGERVFSLDESGEIRSWCLAPDRCGGERGEVIARPHDDPSGWKRTHISGDARGRWLAAQGNKRKQVELYDLAGPLPSEPLILRPGKLIFNFDKAFSPDGRWLASGHGAGLWLWPLDGPRSYAFEGVAGSWAMHFVAASAGLEMALQKGLLSRIPVPPALAAAGTALVQTAGGFMFAVDPQGRYLLFGRDDEVLLVPTAGGAIRRLAGLPPGVEVVGAVAFSLDGSLAAAGVHTGPAESKVIVVWNLDSGEHHLLGPVPGAGVGMDGSVGYLGFTWDGRLLSAGAGISSWSVDRGTWHQILAPSPAKLETSFVISSDGRRLAVGQTLSKDRPQVVHWIDLESGASRVLAAHAGRPLALDSTGTVLLTGNVYTGELRVGRVDDDSTHLLLGHEGGVFVGAIDPSGRWIASRDNQGVARLWPMPDLDKPPLHTLPHDRLIETLHAQTNVRAVRDASAESGWTIAREIFPGWAETPSW